MIGELLFFKTVNCEEAYNKWNRDKQDWNGILLPKLFWPSVRKSCSSDQGFFLKFEA